MVSAHCALKPKQVCHEIIHRKGECLALHKDVHVRSYIN